MVCTKGSASVSGKEEQSIEPGKDAGADAGDQTPGKARTAAEEARKTGASPTIEIDVHDESALMNKDRKK